MSTGRHFARSQAERFREALQPGLMGPRLAAALGGPRTCHVLDAKFEPGVRAVLLYAHDDRLLRGDLLPAPGPVPPDTGRAAPVVAPGVTVHTFPDDPDVATLPQVMDPRRLGPLLYQSPGRCRLTLLRYRPGRRATVLVTRGPGSRSYVVKAYHDTAKAAAVAAEAPGLVAALDPGDVLRFAPTVMHDPALSIVVQQVVEGIPLDALLAHRRGPVPEARAGVLRAARALAELHALPDLSGRRRSVGRELQRFGERASRVGTVDSRLGDTAALLAHRLVDMERQLPPARFGLVHGDCKPSQFLVGDRDVHLLDLDHCGLSDQMADVGSFLATLRQLGVRHALAGARPGRSEELAALADLFLDDYLRRAGAEVQRDRARWQEAVALERKALRAFARAPGSPLAGALLAEANRCLDTMTEGD